MHTARRGNQDGAAFLNLSHLMANAGASIDYHWAEGGAAAELASLVVDLDGELPGWRDDEGEGLLDDVEGADAAPDGDHVGDDVR